MIISISRQDEAIGDKVIKRLAKIQKCDHKNEIDRFMTRKGTARSVLSLYDIDSDKSFVQQFTFSLFRFWEPQFLAEINS